MDKIGWRLKKHLDEESYLHFLDQYFEETRTKPPRGENDNLQHILEKLIETTTMKENQHTLKEY